MRIGYINIGVPSSGVRKKLESKVALMSLVPGINIKLYHVVTDVNSGLEGSIVAFSRWSQFLSRLLFFWRLSVCFQQSKIYSTLNDFVNRNGFDALILRYPGADIFLLLFLKKLNCKILFEHNTLERQELKLRAATSFWYKYFYWNEILFGEWVRRNSNGLIGVTEEITEHQKRISRGRIPSITISNGIEVERVKIRTGPPYVKGQCLKLLFLAGSEAPWHGVDILLNSLLPYTHTGTVHCIIAGNVNDACSKLIQNINIVTYYPILSDSELTKIIDEVHIGVGSLALFRNGMKEASTLKVREYWARGLPFILGYEDTDVMKTTGDFPFYKTIYVNRDLLIFDLAEVFLFAEQAYSIPHLNSKIRQVAIDQIDFRLKRDAYVNFLRQI